VFRAWRDGGERPFLLDNVADLVLVLDHLSSRPDVDPARIGMAGVSLGAMHTWLCAALDDRVAAAAPIIGVQNFRWALENNFFHGRVDSLRAAFAGITRELGKVCFSTNKCATNTRYACQGYRTKSCFCELHQRCSCSDSDRTVHTKAKRQRPDCSHKGQETATGLFTQRPGDSDRTVHTKAKRQRQDCSHKGQETATGLFTQKPRDSDRTVHTKAK
jgi:poly(3-hydroxybutyrate) depolymerase